VVRALLTVLVLTLGATASARAAAVLDISGGGDGHGIGMSQYGAEGYALHGFSDRQILAHYFRATALGTADPHRVVRVLIGGARPSFSGASSASAGAQHVSLQPALTYSVAVDPRGRLVLSTAGRRLKPAFAAPLTVTGPAPLQVGGRGSYRGSLQYSASANGIQTVDSVGLDDYVRGVVAAEMPSSWSPAALQAQAIAARTYAITTTVAGNGFDLYDDTRSQMYGGVSAETAPTDAAVAATAGQIVTYDGQPAVTYFFASSGGFTESIQNVWAGAAAEPWLQGVPDPYDGAANDPYHSFSQQMSLAAARAKLGGLVQGDLVGIQVVRRGVSQRIIAARVIGTKGTTAVTGAQLAAAFGLNTTLVRFAAITTQPWTSGLSGAVRPAPAHARVIVQAQVAGAWRPVGAATVRGNGSFSVSVLAAGRYRITLGALRGPSVAFAPGRSAALVSAERHIQRQS
jgi:stage II sporulation protein D